MMIDKQSVFGTILGNLNNALGKWYSGDPFAYKDLMDDDVTYFTPGMDNRLKGKGAVEAMFATFAGQVHVPSSEITNPELQLGEDMGVFSFIVFEKDSDGAVTVRWRATEVYQRKNDEWKIIHAHWSMIEESS